MDDDLFIRITAEGRASRRWRGAKSATEADRLNWALSEQRAQNIRQAAEEILRRQLPNIRIEVPAWGVGSRDPFPTASEDNAAVDRTVLLMVELTTVNATHIYMPRPPHKIYTPSTIWRLRVESLTSVAGGGKVVKLRIKIRNSLTGKELGFSGTLTGGALGLPTLKAMFKFDREAPSTFGKPIGEEVVFETSEPMDFDDWIAHGQEVRLTHSQVKTGLTNSETTFLQFAYVNHHPDTLVFDLTGFKRKLEFPDFDLSSVQGTLTADGPNPGDHLWHASTAVGVSIPLIRGNHSALLISFPTGKSALRDLTARQQTQITRYLLEKASAIAALALSYNVPTPIPLLRP